MNPTSAATDLVTWLTYAASVLTIVVCLGVIGRAIFTPASIRRSASCGACRHELVDTSTNRCPECGGLLTKVGVTTPTMALRLRGGLAWSLLAWTVIAAIGGRYLISSIRSISLQSPTMRAASRVSHDNYVPFDQHYATRLPVYARDQQPTYEIGLRWTVIEDRGRQTRTLADLDLQLRHTQDRPRSISLFVDSKNRKYQLVDEGGELRKGPVKDISATTIKTMYETVKLDVANPLIALGMTDALSAVNRVLANPDDDFADLMRDPRTNTPVSPRPDGSLISLSKNSVPKPLPGRWQAMLTDYRSLISIAPAAAMYLLGAALITWRYRRLVR